MNPWIAKAVMLAATFATVAIRAPHGARSYRVKVARSFTTRQERVLMTMAWVGFLAPLIWIVSPFLAFADFSLRPAPLAAGVVCLIVSLYLFHKSHVDLGTNWSPTLQVRESHRLVTEGVYRQVRHPMYTSLLLYALGQLLVVPNWLAGPSYLIVMATLVALRVPAEERMMLETFGDEYAAYKARTKRLVPGLW